MVVRIYRWMVLALLLLSPSVVLADGVSINPEECLKCHDNVATMKTFSQSVHGQNGCTSCHLEITDLKRHEDGEQMPGDVKCVRCHKKETNEHYSSVHMLNDIKCFECHTDIHVHQPWQGDKAKVVATCSNCHDLADTYMASFHGKAVLDGNPDSAACNDCHNLHEIQPIGEEASKENKEFHTKVCLKCHADDEMMERNGITKIAVKTYLDSYHGKNYRLGFPEKAAGCSDCHTSHAILPPQDVRSSINPANLVKTCGACHPKATVPFTEYYAHADMTDSAEYPVLYWTFVLMTGLLLGTFTVFWIHTLLWLFRGFVENREKLAELHAGHIAHVIPDGHKQYRRFTGRHIVMHLTVIVSFLGLSLTGLPLKFADQGWARFMMDFFGGTANAGLIHRYCAVLTFAYFLTAILMTINFLFIDKKVKGNFLQRLFGPESLCPNFRDVRDVIGMVKWFLFMGPKPTFERWTYWEKFDFIAVFWGMFAIGGSGLMLWFPEIFGVVLPGWAFNVATIVHSDEALLATGFIFTVHFFNTHGRPEKFPMDFVIFNGQMSKEEFIEERGDQWRRYEEEGTLEKYVVKKPSGVFYDFVLKGFGFIALFTGLGCLILMILALATGSGH